MLIGITGGIGSGKSTIAQVLRRLGYAVYDTDSEAKRIIVENPMVRSQVEMLFGSQVFEGNVYLTQVVAKQVFHHPAHPVHSFRQNPLPYQSWYLSP